MHPDDHVCLCFRVSLRKIQTYLSREDPPVASLISECLGAGTGCGWCVPYLKHLHRQHQLLADQARMPTIEDSAADYEAGRAAFRKTGQRDPSENASERPDDERASG